MSAEDRSEPVDEEDECFEAWCVRVGVPLAAVPPVVALGAAATNVGLAAAAVPPPVTAPELAALLPAVPSAAVELERRDPERRVTRSSVDDEAKLPRPFSAMLFGEEVPADELVVAGGVTDAAVGLSVPVEVSTGAVSVEVGSVGVSGRVVRGKFAAVLGDVGDGSDAGTTPLDCVELQRPWHPAPNPGFEAPFDWLQRPLPTPGVGVVPEVEVPVLVSVVDVPVVVVLAEGVALSTGWLLFAPC